MRTLIPVIVWVILVAATSAGAGPLVQEVSYPGGSERVLFLDPGKPKATVILLVGGDGGINLTPDGTLWESTNFLARTREHWAGKDIAVVLPDIPHGMGSLLGNRENADYAGAVAALVSFAKARNPVPVFLVGHSQGTKGVTSAASRMPPGAVAGIVLTSAISERGTSRDTRETVFDSNLSAITAPVLIVAGEGDACPYSPPDEASRVQAAFIHAASVKVVTVSGLKTVAPERCDTATPHGFFGAQTTTINMIADWIGAILAKG